VRRTIACIALSLSIAVSQSAQGQAKTKTKAPQSAPLSAPLYSISFERKDAVAGIEASHAIKLPFDCTSDGTVFVDMVPADAQFHPPVYVPPRLLLTSVSPSGHANTFPLDQVTAQLFDVSEIDHYVSESSVIFLIRAAKENKPVKQTYTKDDGTQGETTRNVADRSLYVVTFDREGQHKKTTEIDAGFTIEHIGVFPSGDFLVFGYDEKDPSPKLAMLKDDGTLLRFLQIPKGDAPESMFGTKDGSAKGAAVYIAPTQFLADAHSIIVVQNKTVFPLLDVNEGGAITAVRAKLPKGMMIDALIASDQHLYALVNPATEGSIYEIAEHDGTVLRRFDRSDGRSASGVACVHDGKFLSFDHGEGKLIPLVGTAEPAVASEKQGKAVPPAN
jgi:hypothetical protein